MHEFCHYQVKVIIPMLVVVFLTLTRTERNASMLHIPTWDVLITTSAT
jgi:hypothetical protein